MANQNSQSSKYNQSSETQETVEAQVKSILFRNEDNQYSVLKLEGNKPKGEFISTGVYPNVSKGEEIRAIGKWVKHPKFGEQFQVQIVEVIQPKGHEAIIRHLSSGLYRKIGPKTAENIADHFGEATMDILRADPTRIKEVPRFTGERIELFIEDWKTHQGSRDVLYFLHQHEIAAGIAMRIYKKFGDQTMLFIKQNPYILAEEIWGIGFHKADQIARHFEIDLDHPQRFKAAINYLVNRSALDGHTFLPEKILFQQAIKILTEIQIQEHLFTMLTRALSEMEQEKQIIRVMDRVFQPSLYYSEEFISIWVKRRLIVPQSKIKSVWKKRLKAFESFTKIEFSNQQTEAIYTAISSSFFVLTGGPGTGKTTLLKGLLASLDDDKIKIKLAAPTGRAAKRMEELSGKKALTLHRLLEYNPQDHSFQKHASEQLSVDYVIVDEASMIDTRLMSGLMEALPASCRLILIGDKDQLPSVGPGQVLSNLLDIDEIPKVCLDRIYRQEEGSDIPHNANRILLGKLPEFKKKTHFHIREHSSIPQAKEIVQSFTQHDIPKYFKLDPMKEIQVLTPMRKGQLGTYELNDVLQKALNTDGQEHKVHGRQLRIGDKMMQIKNNYDKNIYNGDIGYLRSVNTQAKTFVLDFDELIEYEFNEIDELVLAYATTIHKSQGSEYPVVIVVLDPSHSIMLQRNLLYTAVTRAKDRVFLISPQSCIAQCIYNDRIQQRFTHLLEHLSPSHVKVENFMAEPTAKESHSEQVKTKEDSSEFMGFLDDEK